MKHQQVVVDYWAMLKTSCICLLLAISGYVLIKMVQTIFYLPGYLKNNQKRLEELAAKYNIDLETEIAEAEKKIAVESCKENEQPRNDDLSKDKDTVENLRGLENEPKKVK